MPRLNKEVGRDTGDLFQNLNAGAHQGHAGSLMQLARDGEKLANWFRGPDSGGVGGLAGRGGALRRKRLIQ
jgi:hypothetical protein